MALTKAHFRMIAGQSFNVKDYGAIGDGVANDASAILGKIQRMGGILPMVIGKSDVAPTVLTFAVGDMVFNSGAAAGGKAGWICTTAGTPGTWKPFGAIDA